MKGIRLFYSRFLLNFFFLADCQIACLLALVNSFNRITGFYLVRTGSKHFNLVHPFSESE